MSLRTPRKAERFEAKVGGCQEVTAVALRVTSVHALRDLPYKLAERLHREVKARYWAVLDEAARR